MRELLVRPVRNVLGHVVRAVLADNGGLYAAYPPGRLLVAPGQSISSEWGNTTHDQSIICFASAADRDNQFPVPHRGAMCWVDDVKALYQYNGTGWAQTAPRQKNSKGPITYTTNAVGDFTVAHGLGVVPGMVDVQSPNAGAQPYSFHVIAADAANFTVHAYYGNAAVGNNSPRLYWQVTENI
jgi:hypothetical protein